MARPPLGQPIAVVIAALLAVAAGCGGCDGAEPERGAPAARSSAVVEAPDADERLPREPRRLATRLAQVSDGLARAVDRWRAEGDPATGHEPDEVALHALYQQRAYRLLARRPRLTAAVLRELPTRLRPMTRDATSALRALFALTPPQRRARRFRTGPPQPADVLRGHYRHAERRFGVDWHVLAAMNLVETGFGRVRSTSSAGARGPMQFIPSTWRAYGMGGDVDDPRDAILGAANYLRASGAPGSYRRALHAYNPSPLYVHAVLRFSRRIARSPRAFYALYAWQVFVRTPSGDVRLTGPGAG
jgi:soluble lytic murein transglycosylase-like protein